MKSVFLLLSLVVLLFPFFASAQTGLPAPGAATSTGAADVNSDPNLVATSTQQDSLFQWFGGVTTTGASSWHAPTSDTASGTVFDHLFVFQTTEGNTAEVDEVSVHYSVDGQAQLNFDLTNSTDSYWTRGFVISSPSKVQFSFTYKSIATNTQEDSYVFEYDAATNKITQVTVVVVPSPSTLVVGPQQSSSISSLTWYPAIQLYSNVADEFTVEFRSNNAGITNDWVDLHYIISVNGVDGLSQSFSMKANNSLPANADGTQPNYYYQTITTGLSGDDKLKFNFTYLDGQMGVGQNTLAFLWSPSVPNVINYMNSINDNVDVNPTNGAVATYTSSTGVNGPTSSNTNGTTTNTNNNNNNTKKTPNGAVGQQASVMAVSLIAAVAFAASML